jgi:predicted NUDIX family phosphoesterase
VSEALSERVLCIPTKVLHDAGLFQGLSLEVEHYLPRVLDPGQFSFRPRSEVENDPSFKQIIPYVVLRCGEMLYYYTRGKKGTEARLRALRSIGVGGHISVEDAGGSADPYRTGMLRELQEEIHLDSGYHEACIGLINDDSTPVGQVHLGIVHLFELAEAGVRRREDALTEDGFAELRELLARIEEFETWSRFVLEALGSDSSPKRKRGLL